MSVIYSPEKAAVEGHFHAGDVVVFELLPLSHIGFLMALPIHDNADFKKMKMRNVTEPINDLGKHCLRVWATDREQAITIQRVLIETQDEARRYVQQWFPSLVIRPEKEMHSWRYTETGPEPMHLDKYADRVVTPVIRLFINLDTKDRVWDILQQDVGSSQQVRRIWFPPGSAWLCDSQKVSHSIIYGRRGGMFSWES